MRHVERPAREVEETRSREEAPPPAPEPAEERRAPVRRLPTGEFQRERGERIRKDDTDVPAFLRKMMD